ncbi:hypothetical protein ATL17_1619 [Maritalea mobilis]|uniref:Uncharacterized protein n=1 Tax=Maritalea mobilis TaxID=483324 RepID=A0A4R6VN45_9HYPH|nr:hypothetical protein [Maritalea mobilis]TDQ63612.1 hypothetical protein ATL17_1619 [Maritalea mobilis]
MNITRVETRPHWYVKIGNGYLHMMAGASPTTDKRRARLVNEHQLKNVLAQIPGAVPYPQTEYNQKTDGVASI